MFSEAGIVPLRNFHNFQRSFPATRGFPARQTVTGPITVNGKVSIRAPGTFPARLQARSNGNTPFWFQSARRQVWDKLKPAIMFQSARRERSRRDMKWSA